MTWMTRISEREFAELGGLSNSKLRCTLDERGEYAYFRPSAPIPKIIQERRLTEQQRRVKDALRDWELARIRAERGRKDRVCEWIDKFTTARVNAGMPVAERG